MQEEHKEDMDEKLRFPNNMSHLTQDRQHQVAKTQWRAIVYTAVLLLGGSVLLVLGSMIVTGHLDPDTHGERFWPLVLLGGLMFIPGAYHVYFAYKAFTGDPDWSFDEFPDF